MIERTHVTVIEDPNEPKIISPGVRQGHTYRVIEERSDHFLIAMGGKPVMLDKFLVSGSDGKDKRRKRGRSDFDN